MEVFGDICMVVTRRGDAFRLVTTDATVQAFDWYTRELGPPHKVVLVAIGDVGFRNTAIPAHGLTRCGRRSAGGILDILGADRVAIVRRRVLRGTCAHQTCGHDEGLSVHKKNSVFTMVR